MINFFLSHVSDNKRTNAMAQILLERLKSYKILQFDYYDEYSREWFKHIYHLPRSLTLNKLNISSNNLLTYLKKVSLTYPANQHLWQKYSKRVAEKIVSALNMAGQTEINFTNYLGSIRANLMAKGQRDQLKFCFNLFDHDGNGYICPNDIDVFNTQYTGTCSLLSSDFLALANMFSFKSDNPNYIHSL